ncbi:hypothetical protein Pan216_24910 [Planctomycetes bacterium Pan216]|uniref:DUF4185 domain-containing protein n=1 Tax=Kolteria novifilia TaxID=2527975 RepID=A0A518B3R7_9BACT|nr:hypothetical protein Pan216_24910 [Planctomycetes bacterium Pan216]
MSLPRAFARPAVQTISQRRSLGWLLLLVVSLTAPSQREALALEPCRIDVVDESNGWPVPLVELRTTHHVRFVTDNAGRIAFDLPELMNQETWFTVEGHGYGVTADGFGQRGVRLTPRPGERLTVNVHRQLPAKRLGRITGGGLFGESQKLGLEKDWRDQGVLGCDSVQTVAHQGKLYWNWGDTTVPHYPLGIFDMTGATTSLKPLKHFEPPIRLHYDYVVDEKGRPRGVAPIAGSGPTWLSGYASLPDASGAHHLVATYSKIRPPLEEYEVGLCVWNDDRSLFEKERTLWTKSRGVPKSPPCPRGHPVSWKDDAGAEWMLFGDPFPALKCRATFEDWSDPSRWQALEPQGTVISRDGTEQVKPHRGCIAWNAYRRKWVAIFTQMYGKPSLLGEIWYAEADAPTGPWRDAVNVVTHQHYTFYNPRIHPEFTNEDSPVLLFEGTYTKTFSQANEATPRHDYNQVLYRLDLDDPDLVGSSAPR